MINTNYLYYNCQSIYKKQKNNKYHKIYINKNKLNCINITYYKIKVDIL